MYRLDDVLGMKMDGKVKRPPNWNDIIAVFPKVEFMHGVLFCYGDTIYNPDNVDIPVWLLGHECVHSLQQAGIGVSAWWEDYLAEPNFRLEQELAAHRVELESYSVIHSRNLRRAYAHAVAQRLGGQLYGNLIKPREALRLIKEKDDDKVEAEDTEVLVSDATPGGDREGSAVRDGRGASTE